LQPHPFSRECPFSFLLRTGNSFWLFSFSLVTFWKILFRTFSRCRYSPVNRNLTSLSEENPFLVVFLCPLPLYFWESAPPRSDHFPRRRPPYPLLPLLNFLGAATPALGPKVLGFAWSPLFPVWIFPLILAFRLVTEAPQGFF